MDVLQDRRGYIWLATEDGLNRYDGTGFKVYKHDAADAGSLPDSFVWDVEEDAAGILWIATRSGLASWDPATDRITRQESIGGRHIRALRHSKKDNVLWVATRDSGVLRYDVATGQLKPFAHDARDAASLLDDHVYALAIDAQGRLWVGSEGGLDRLNENGKGFTHFVPNAADRPPRRGQGCRALSTDTRAALWVGNSAAAWTAATSRPGASSTSGTTPPSRRSLANDQVRAILQDADGGSGSDTSGGLDLLDAAHGTFAHYGQDAGNPTSLGRRPRALPRPGPRRRAVGGDAQGGGTSGTR
jgi:ligand-binding sensor domain-containing protein